MENVNSTQRRKLLALHKGEVNTLIAARHAELGWIAHDDGCGAVLQLGARSEHQKRCHRAIAYESSCFRHAFGYWLPNVSFLLIWVFWLWPEVSRCEERSRAWLRSPDGGGLPSLAAEESAIESCGKWVDGTSARPSAGLSS